MAKFTVENQAGRLVLRKPWRSAVTYFLTVFAVVWNGAMLVALLSGAGFFLIFHLIAGLIIAYVVASMWMNTTTITADRRQLKVERGPLPVPFRKNWEVSSGAVTQLFVRKGMTQKNNQRTYDLVAKLDTGAEQKLIHAETKRDELLEIERLLENHLGIEDDPSMNVNKNDLDMLAQLQKGMEKLDQAPKWIPDSIKEKLKAGMARAALEHLPPDAARGRAAGASPLPAGTGYTPPPPVTDERNDFRDHQADLASALELPGTFYPGQPFTYRSQGYTLVRSAYLAFDDPNYPNAHQLELSGPAGTVYLYAAADGKHFRYYEERRLDDAEVASLGFTPGAGQPYRLENGEDRYYTGAPKTGTRTVRGTETPIEQFTYVANSALADFRAVRVDRKHWEVYVMELVPQDLVGLG